MLRTYVCFLLTSSFLASGQTWLDFRAAAVKALESGSPAKAESALLSAWDTVSRDPTKQRARAILSEDLAYLYLDQGKPDVSLKFCREGIEMAGTANPLQVADLMNTTAIILRTRGAMAESEKMHNQALSVLRSTGNGTSYAAAETYFGLGVLMSYLGRLDSAEEYLQKAIAMSAPFEAANADGRARMIDSIARLYTNWGRLHKAEKYQKVAWKVAESQPDPDPKLLMDLLDSRGTLLFEQAKYAESERAWKKARDISSTCAGCRAHLYPVLSHLGELYVRLGEYDKAQDTVEQTMALAKEIRSLPAADLALLKGEMGYIKARRKHFDEARALLVQSVAELEKSGRPLELAVISAYYGEFFARQGYWEQAAEQYDRTLKLRQQVLGNHPLTVTALLNCADAYKKLKRKSEAKKYRELAENMSLQCSSCLNQGQTVDVRAFR